MCAFIIYGIIENNFIWESKESIKFRDLPDGLNGKRILIMSDLHKKRFGKRNKRLINKIKRLAPDAIILAGDMINRDCTDFGEISNLLEELCGICDVYYGLGNHEIDREMEDRMRLCKILENTDANILDDRAVEYGGIRIAGISLYRANYRVKKGVYKGLRDYNEGDIEKSIGKKDGFTILIAHNPFFLDAYESWGADLIISGHVHGGVIRLPLIGGILSPERKLFPKYSAGIYKKGKSVMYVSRGLGKIRLFNPPQITIMTLLKGED